MAGRGRGRGRGAIAVAAETLGIGRGDLPPPTLQPPPLFPPLEFKPVPLLSGEDYDYMLALKQEYRGTMRESPYFIKPSGKRKDIYRYSDKYQTNGNSSHNDGFQPDWGRLPAELKIKVKRVARSGANFKPNLTKGSLKKSVKLSEDEVKKKLQNLEEEETKDTTKGGGEEENEEEEEGEEGEEYYEEEDMEEGTDYNMTYFDNGEEFALDEDDALDDGPTY
ncbi:DNA-directed RNA polymerase III subunit RPC7-like [Glandiceps talaboti]